MAGLQREEVPPAGTIRRPAHRSRQRIVLALTFLFVLAAAFVSSGLVVYTAWHHDLENGLFALAFAVLSTRAVLSWFLWHSTDQPANSSANQQDPESRKLTDGVIR